MLVGFAQSAFQNEPGERTPPTDSNWYQWMSWFDYKKGPDYWRGFRKHHRLARLFGANAWRTSVDGIRLSQDPGGYLKILEDAKKQGLTVFLTVHHWIFPKGVSWLKGGRNFILETTKLAADTLSDVVDYWITLNEPFIETYSSYMSGNFPPGEKSFRKFLKAFREAVKTHKKMYKILKRTGKPVGIAFNLPAFRGNPVGISIRQFLVFYMLRAFRPRDFVGVNYYGSIHLNVLGIDVSRPDNLYWQEDPSGLKHVLGRINEPIAITECGIWTEDEKRRLNFIRRHLLAASKFPNVFAFLYWTLLDNIEWNIGTSKFGVADVKGNPKIPPDTLRKAFEKVKYI